MHMLKRYTASNRADKRKIRNLKASKEEMIRWIITVQTEARSNVPAI